MTRQLLFLGLLVASSVYAGARGGGPEKIGAAALLGGAVASVAVAQPFAVRFQQIEVGILVVDFIMLSVFLWLSLRSTRFWPLWIAALLGAEIVVHLMRIAVPNIVPRAYMDAVAMWAWAAQMILIAATWRHGARFKRLGADPSWRN